jgi:hypothetical protein
MNFTKFLIESSQQNDLLSGNTEIKHKFNSDFKVVNDVFHFRHNMDYQAQLPMEIVKALGLSLVKENVINWNKSGTQKTTEKYFSNGTVGIYMFSGTGMQWVKTMTGLLGTHNEDEFERAKLILQSKGILKL